MKTFLKESQKEIILGALFYILIGVALIIFDISILTTCIKVIGGILILFGAYQLYVFFIRRLNLSSIPLIFGVFLCAIGFLLIRNPHFIIKTASICTGIILIFNAVIHIQASLIQKDYGYDKWKGGLIYSAILLIIGCIFFFSPIKSAQTVLKISGVLLIIQGLVLWITQHRINSFIKKADQSDDYIEGEYKEL